MRHTLPIALLLVLAAPSWAQKKPEVRPWERFEGGIQITTKEGVFCTTLSREELEKIVLRITELHPFYEKHFDHELDKKWTVTVLSDFDEYNAYAKETTKGQRNVQGQCFADRREVVVCDSKRYGWFSTLSHEYAHAFYPSVAPIWVREGAVSLVEVVERIGKGKYEIPINPPRLRGLGVYQKKGHYLDIIHLLRGEKEADGYGYSYEHGWSLNYFLFETSPKRYKAFILEARDKGVRDLSEIVTRIYGMDVDDLNAKWKTFIDGLEVGED